MPKVILTSGKKKTAIARAIIRPGKGKIRINKIPLEIFEPELCRWKIMEPVILAGTEIINQIDINIDVRGGGFMGQTEAVRTALAKAISEWTDKPEIKRKFLEYDRMLLVSDARRKEPKKFGGRGARQRFQKSYR
ncbi:30S ribosomal protein S9 [Candidatus Borrarchaeum sp.]|uniref:30S ribosomal protein S9 n=1 Tax=Candidatus Borrarchaeum sp. TaxID=2846742 RepID=UPI00257C5B0A|nr:30S ribosomal protein S9 [Candidatus Borrarchaeum sp.]